MSVRPGLRRALLLVVGAVLVLSFALFAVLFVAYRRGDDPHNEDVLRQQAEKARLEGNHGAAARLYRQLYALNPFEDSYAARYLHALVDLRDFRTLEAATNGTATVVVLTDRERAVEAAIARGSRQMRDGQGGRAIATFESVTNLNFCAVAPFLVQAYLQDGRPGQALAVSLGCIRQAPNRHTVMRAAELSALALRRDLVLECRAAALRLSGRAGLALAHYCDALAAWLEGSPAALAQAMETLDGEVDAPLARLLALECAANGKDARAVEQAYQDLASDEPAESPTLLRARLVVKRFLSSRFPKDITVNHIQRLTELIYDRKHPDVDILRLSLLAKSARGILLTRELDEAQRLFPNDRGLAVIRRQHEAGIPARD